MRHFVLALLLALPSRLRSQDGANAVALFEAHRYREARTAFEAEERSAPNDARSAYYLGRLALVDGNGEEGARWLERAVKREPSRADYHYWLGRAYSREALRAGKFKQMQLAGHIREEFETAVRLAPANVDARFGLMQFYLVAPGLFGGSVDKAARQAAEIQRLNPFLGHVAAAAVAEKRKDVAGAEREYLTAVGTYPDSVFGAFALVGLYERTKQYDKAFDVLDKVAGRPGAEATDYYVGRIAAVSGQRLDRGAQALAAYVRRDPVDGAPSLASAHYRLGMIYERQGKRDLARAEYEKTLALDPGQNEAKDALKRVR
ncbi:MAG TPA: tetratricopeptide repeat protein [Gemmatimonadaceae bacterium]|nr:tetratricopeptide repeat protein [Gemmatimonadaceae bacterium]